jgi:hypothetical protein
MVLFVHPIRFRFAPLKALTAVLWMLRQRDGLDLHTIAKAAYFADKAHLNQHGRPIFGATYRAMKYGPVPVEIYEMLKQEPIYLPELDRETYPWTLNGYRIFRQTDAHCAEGHLSPSDMRCLREGFARSVTMTFNERTAATHGVDWQRAELGMMDYADMLDETPDKAELVEELRMMASRLAL